MVTKDKDQVVDVNSARGEKKARAVYVVTEKEGRSYWTAIGTAHDNADGSTTIKLDALPLAGTLQVRGPSPEGTDDASRKARVEKAKASVKAAQAKEAAANNKPEVTRLTWTDVKKGGA